MSIPLYMHILVSVSLYTYIPYISTTYLHTRAFVISPYFPICIFTHCVSRITIFLPVLGFYICYDSLRYTSRYSIFILLPYICISTFHYISNDALYNDTYYNICCCIYITAFCMVLHDSIFYITVWCCHTAVYAFDLFFLHVFILSLSGFWVKAVATGGGWYFVVYFLFFSFCVPFLYSVSIIYI